jgi:hypothetical protein
MGYTTEDGVFYPLKSGDEIQILRGSEVASPTIEARVYEGALTKEEQVDPSQIKVWIPEPAKGDKRLRLKYGVLLKGPSLTGQMSGEFYRLAYLEKLKRLVEKEILTPVAVILDRFFAAPHLAAGNPMQIAEATWRELEEIRRPVQIVTEWIEQQDEATLNRLIYPFKEQDLEKKPASEEEQKKELEELSLEEFLEFL